MALTLYIDSFSISPYAFAVYTTLEEKGVPYVWKTVSLPDKAHHQSKNPNHLTTRYDREARRRRPREDGVPAKGGLMAFREYGRVLGNKPRTIARLRRCPRPRRRRRAWASTR